MEIDLRPLLKSSKESDFDRCCHGDHAASYPAQIRSDLWKNQKESEWQKLAMEEFSSMTTKIFPNYEQDPDI